MKAVARLLLVHFAGSPGIRWLNLSGLLLLLASLYVVFYLPQRQHMLAAALPGVILLLLGTSLMPMTVGRLAGSHQACVLPGARVKLFISAVLTVLLVALPVGLLTPLVFVAGMSAEIGKLRTDPALFDYALQLALYTYVTACLAAAWAYSIIWFVGRANVWQGPVKAGAVSALFVVIPAMGHGRIEAILLQLVLTAVVFGLGFLYWPRVRPSFDTWWRSLPTFCRRRAREFAGREIDVLLGSARPWLMIAALLAPILMIALHSATPRKHSDALFFLAIMSCIGGAVAGQLPARARLLWLLGDWTRARLFTAVENAAWRHNGLVLVVVLPLYLLCGILADAPPQIVGAGIGLLTSGMVLSTYLGLLRTRGVYWLESVLGILVIAAMMTIAALVSEQAISPSITWLIMSAMGGVAVALRQWARHRWAHIDWSMTRNETQRALRTA